MVPPGGVKLQGRTECIVLGFWSFRRILLHVTVTQLTHIITMRYALPILLNLRNNPIRQVLLFMGILRMSKRKPRLVKVTQVTQEVGVLQLYF